MLKSSQIKAAEPSQQEIAVITKRGEMRERKASSERKRERERKEGRKKGLEAKP